MVDKALPHSKLPLRWLFLDFNSYFASVEQAEHPELRDKPIGVSATPGDSGTIIAASYPAKAFGIKTGTLVGEAKRLCPDFITVPAKHSLYTNYHQRILTQVENVLPVDRVCSIDEMRFRLLGDEMQPQNALQLAHKMKETIAAQVSPCLTCSIGIAPNAFLAKLATDLQKPNGLVMIQAQDLPERLYGLDLKEFAGINTRMEARLQAHGIFNSTDLLQRSKKELVTAFGSIIGERWWHLLRGHDLDFDTEKNKSLGHSHVLPPELRTDQGCREILMRLTHKACARLRSTNLWATHAAISVRGRDQSWAADFSLPPTQDPHLVFQKSLTHWEHRTFRNPIKVSITFTKLRPSGNYTPSLFEDSAEDHTELNQAVDNLNQKFGKNSLYLAALHRAKDHASEKIAFNKTWLFQEGKDDNVWKPDQPENKEKP